MIVLHTEATPRGAFGNTVKELQDGSFAIQPFTPESLLAFFSQFGTIRCELDESGIHVYALGENRGFTKRNPS